MVNEGKSKKASKRLQKEADLVVSSWKLADQLYTSFYGDCWPGPGIYHLRKTIINPCGLSDQLVVPFIFAKNG